MGNYTDLQVLSAIKRVVKKRVQRGASDEDIERYKDGLLNVWKSERIRVFIQSL